MSVAISPVCGALGCTADADTVVDHPDHGERVVCADHAENHEAIGDV